MDFIRSKEDKNRRKRGNLIRQYCINNKGVNQIIQYTDIQRLDRFYWMIKWKEEHLTPYQTNKSNTYDMFPFDSPCSPRSCLRCCTDMWPPGPGNTDHTGYTDQPPDQVWRGTRMSGTNKTASVKQVWKASVFGICFSCFYLAKYYLSIPHILIIKQLIKPASLKIYCCQARPLTP